MFSLFASPYCAPAPAVAEPSFTTLFRLLDDFDSYSREAQAPQSQQQQQQCSRPRHHIRRTVTTTFRPKFDVRETQTAYELHGELPGIEKENLNIEFTDPQTIVVRGHVERTYESKPEAEEQAVPVTTATPAAEPASDEKTSDDNDDTASNASSHGWHHATVEDDPEEPATPPGATTPTDTPKTEVVKPAAPVTPVQKAPESAPAVAPKKEKVWLYERSIGQFSRSFTFPTRVEHENVSANLENGVLSITVPKAPKHQLRRIAIF